MGVAAVSVASECTVIGASTLKWKGKKIDWPGLAGPAGAPRWLANHLSQIPWIGQCSVIGYEIPTGGRARAQVLGLAVAQAVVEVTLGPHCELVPISVREVKMAATGNPNADKPAVEQGVRGRVTMGRMKLDNHAWDAIAVTLAVIDRRAASP